MTATGRLIHDPDGLNSGTATTATADQFITPVDRFFTRSHAPVPAIDARTWRLEIGGLVERPLVLSLAELRARFAPRGITATLACAGLRRAELLPAGALHGELLWGAEAISTGAWTGVGLGDVLRAAGVSAAARFVEFTGLDVVERDGNLAGFGGSIDLDKAIGEEVLLAMELNGSPLTPRHGFPLRAIVPGWIGARSVKWLGRITLSATPSTNYFQTKAYRIARTVDPEDPRNVAAGVPLTGVPLNAVITAPRAGDVVRAGSSPIRGWAMGSAGRPLRAVQVSATDGEDWTPARIVVDGGRWAWSFWEALVPLGAGRHTLVARAVDGGDDTQPAELRDAWNVKGYCNNAWHRVVIAAE